MAKKEIVTTGSSKSKKAEQARALAESLRAKQEAADKRNRFIFGGILGGIAVILVGVLVYIALANPYSEANLRKKIDDVAAAPSNFNSDGSFTVSANGGGKSKALSGAVTLEVYNDFMCPACGYFERTYGSTLRELVDSKKVNLVFHPLAWFDSTSALDKATKSNDEYSTRAASAAIYVAQNAPDKYMDFIEQMYAEENQPCEGYKGENTTQCSRPEKGYDPEVGSDAKIVEHIEAAGISKDIAQAAVGGTYREYIKAVSGYVSGLKKVTATPAIFINGEKFDLQSAKGGTEDFKNAVLAKATK
jgi:protein-disulfide isomerase